MIPTGKTSQRHTPPPVVRYLTPAPHPPPFGVDPIFSWATSPNSRARASTPLSESLAGQDIDWDGTRSMSIISWQKRVPASQPPVSETKPSTPLFRPDSPVASGTSSITSRKLFRPLLPALLSQGTASGSGSSASRQFNTSTPQRKRQGITSTRSPVIIAGVPGDIDEYQASGFANGSHANQSWGTLADEEDGDNGDDDDDDGNETTTPEDEIAPHTDDDDDAEEDGDTPRPYNKYIDDCAKESTTRPKGARGKNKRRLRDSDDEDATNDRKRIKDENANIRPVVPARASTSVEPGPSKRGLRSKRNVKTGPKPPSKGVGPWIGAVEGSANFQTRLGKVVTYKWSYSPGGIQYQPPHGRAVGDIHFSTAPAPGAECPHWVRVGSNHAGPWELFEAGQSHPLYSTYVLTLRDGGFPPCWLQGKAVRH